MKVIEKRIQNLLKDANVALEGSRNQIAGEESDNLREFGCISVSFLREQICFYTQLLRLDSRQWISLMEERSQMLKHWGNLQESMLLSDAELNVLQRNLAVHRQRHAAAEMPMLEWALKILHKAARNS